MRRDHVGAVRGTPVAWVSYGWLSLYVAVLIAPAVGLLTEGPPGPGGWTALAAVLALACAVVAAIGVQLERRFSAGPLRLERTDRGLRITSSMTWLHACEITASPGDTVTMAVAAGSQSMLRHLTKRGPIVSVPGRHHVVVILHKGQQRLAAHVFAKPDGEWAKRLADDLRSAGVNIELLP